MSRSLLSLLALLPAVTAAADHIGAEACKVCHPAAYEAWRDSAHARALDALPPAKRKDARCTVCHAPEVEKGALSVDCETCHGAGRIYAQSYVMRDRELARAVGLVDPGERTCAACHTESAPGLERFEFAKKLPLIEHGGDRVARGRGARPATPPRRQGP